MTGRSSQNLRNRSSTKPQSQFPNSPLQSPNNGTDGDDDAPSPRSEEIPTKKESASGWAVRTRWTLILLAIFIVLISIGHSALTLLVIACQVSMYREIVAIGFKWNKEKELPLFRTLNWYFYACVSAWVYSRTMRDIILETSTLGKLLYWPIHYNTFVFYSSLCIGIVLFVLNLKKSFYKYQFQQMAWTAMSLILVVFPTTFVISNIYQGIIWFILPALLVVANDVFAFIFGKLFGKTPLISLSPKKTWEGFIGATITTFAFGFVFPIFFSKIQFLICPKHNLEFGYPECTPQSVFVPVVYKLPEVIVQLFSLDPSAGYSIIPMQWIGVMFAAFASIIAPFGGFLASGFKRAYGIKDFGDSIPGHGGVTDRMDCQILMGVFVNVFYFSFVKSPDFTVSSLLQSFLELGDLDQIDAFQQIRELLVVKGLIA